MDNGEWGVGNGKWGIGCGELCRDVIPKHLEGETWRSHEVGKVMVELLLKPI